MKMVGRVHITPQADDLRRDTGSLPNDDDASGNDNDNDIISRKKLRRDEQIDRIDKIEQQEVAAVAVGEDLEGGGAQQQQERSPSPRQWWFSRHSLSTTVAAASDTPSTVVSVSPAANGSSTTTTTSGMVLSEHLGTTSDVVESLTHDVKNWSLTRISTSNNATATKTPSSIDKKKEKQTRCKDAQRQVRRAQRRCLVEQQQHLRISDDNKTN